METLVPRPVPLLILQFQPRGKSPEVQRRRFSHWVPGRLSCEKQEAKARVLFHLQGESMNSSASSGMFLSTVAIVGGDAEENMDRVRPEAEAWRLTHIRYAQNTLTAETISGSLFHDYADEHNQVPDEFVVSMESKEQKKTEDLAGMQAHHHELQILLPRSLDEYQTKFRDEHNEITKTMKDLSVIQHQAELEEKADNEQQLRKELSR